MDAQRLYSDFYKKSFFHHRREMHTEGLEQRSIKSKGYDREVEAHKLEAI